VGRDGEMEMKEKVRNWTDESNKWRLWRHRQKKEARVRKHKTWWETKIRHTA